MDFFFSAFKKAAKPMEGKRLLLLLSVSFLDDNYKKYIKI